MNGGNSSTFGTDVPSLATLPAAAYPLIVTALQQVLKGYQSVAAGDSSPILLDFSEMAGSDQVPDEVMSEIARRIIATVETPADTSNILFQASAPDDHTKAWQQIDPVTNLPVGQYKIWDNTSQAWLTPTQISNPIYVPPQERFTRIVPPPGNSSQVVTFADMLTVNYTVQITPTTYNAGSYAAAPSSISGFGAILSNKDTADITINFYGIPNIGTSLDPVGLSYDIWIRATPSS